MTVTKPELGECVFPTPMPSSLASAVPSAASAEHLLQHLPITAGGSLLSTSGTDPASASGASFEGNDDDNPIQTAWQVRERSTNAAAGSSLGKTSMYVLFDSPVQQTVSNSSAAGAGGERFAMEAA